MLELENLYFGYGPIPILDGVQISFPTGQIACMLGRNGAGKTTLMQNIVGLLSHQAGKIHLVGKSIGKKPVFKRAQAGLTLVPQGRLVFPKLTVRENIRVGLEARDDRLRKVPATIYDRFPVLKTYANRRAGDLSGGQQQQLAIARALATSPRVLLLDEPTEGIQPNIVEDISILLQELVTDRARDYGMAGPLAIVLVEQNLGFVRMFDEHIFYLLENGKTSKPRPISDLTDEWCHRHLGM